jgi:acetyltransferase-like isoleucine patch superfamily enzyme
MTEESMSIILKEMPNILNQFCRIAIQAMLRPLPSPRLPLIAQPGLHLRWRLGWIKGWACRPFWKIRACFGGPKIAVGQRLSIQGRLRTWGAGTIELGSDVLIDGRTDLYTHSKEARIRVGDCVFLNGTRISSQLEISIGDLCILSDARIMDTDFHAITRDRQSKSALVRTAPVRIGKNAWIAAGAAILKGVTIGDDSVVGFGSVVTQDIPAGVIASGNPAKISAELPQ